MQKPQFMWWLLHFINQKIKIKNKKFLCNPDYIWFKGSTSFIQNWHSFLLSFKGRYKFIIYMIINNIFISINKYWIH